MKYLLILLFLFSTQGYSEEEKSIKEGKLNIKDIKFENGDRYIGQVKNNTKHGSGKYIWVNGNIYEGIWENNKRTHGMFKWSNGNVYIGGFLEGKFSGSGIIKYSNGNAYEGEWKEGKKHGEGLLIEDKIKYQGEFKNGKFHGNGKLWCK